MGNTPRKEEAIRKLLGRDNITVLQSYPPGFGFTRSLQARFIMPGKVTASIPSSDLEGDDSEFDLDPLEEACARIGDMLKNDDGQAHKEARKFLERRNYQVEPNLILAVAHGPHKTLIYRVTIAQIRTLHIELMANPANWQGAVLTANLGAYECATNNADEAVADRALDLENCCDYFVNIETNNKISEAMEEWSW